METPDKFMQLVLGLQSSAWMMLGKVANPITGTTDCNLPAAKDVIDTLQMLKEKTKGNLVETEESLLTSTIQQLEMNYVIESKKPESKEKVEEVKEEKTEKPKKK